MLLGLSIGIFAVCWLLLIGLYLELGRARKKQLRNRLNAVRSDLVADFVDDRLDFVEIERAYAQNETGLTLALLRLANLLGLTTPKRAVKYVVLGFLGVSIGTSGFLYRLDIMPVALLPLIGLAAGVGLAGMMAKAYTEKERNLFLDQFPDTIDLIVRAVRVGIPLAEAIASVANEAEEPVRSEFQTIADGLSAGVDFTQILKASARRVPLIDYQFFVVCMLIQRETGAPVSEILGTLSATLRRRKELRLKVRAMTAEPRTSANVIAAVPLLVSIGIFFISPAHIIFLFDDPEGKNLLLMALVFIALGMVSIKLLLRFKWRS